MIFSRDEADWSRPDYAAIAGSGFVSVSLDDWAKCNSWLAGSFRRSLDRRWKRGRR